MGANQKDRKQALHRYEDNKKRNVMATPGVHEFVLVLDHLKSSFNVPKLFRSAETFGAAAVHLVNIGVFDPSPAKGAFRKVPAHFHDDFESCYQQLLDDGYCIYALTPVQSQSLSEITINKKAAFILGHEEQGLSFDLADYPEIKHLYIQQFGQTESLNVSIAGSIVMYEYCRQHAK